MHERAPGMTRRRGNVRSYRARRFRGNVKSHGGWMILGGVARDDEVFRTGRLPAVAGDRFEGERARK